MPLASVTYTFQDPSGKPLADGTVTFRLNTDAVAGTDQISAGRLIKAALDSSGSCTIELWGNNTMLPAGTVYIVKAYTAEGQLAWEGQLTAGPPLWLSTLTYGVAYHVVYAGNVYRALLENFDKEPDTNPTFWALVV
jgi:hypothetical protein